MATSVDDMIKMLARAEDVAKPATKATDATKVPDGMDAFLRLIPPPRESVPKPRDPRAETIHIVEEGDGYRKVGLDRFNAIDIRVTDTAHQVDISRIITPDTKGKGIGVEMYIKAAEDALAEGKVFRSDSEVSADAQNVWEALERRGYILERNTRAKLDEESGKMYVPHNRLRGDQPVFTIVGKQQPVEAE